MTDFYRMKYLLKMAIVDMSNYRRVYVFFLGDGIFCWYVWWKTLLVVQYLHSVPGRMTATELETPAAIQGNAGNKARDDLFKKFRKMNENDDKLSIQKIAAMGSKPCDVDRGPLSSFWGGHLRGWVSAMYVWPWCQTLCLQKGSGMCHDENVHTKLYKFNKLYKDAIWFMLLMKRAGNGMTLRKSECKWVIFGIIWAYPLETKPTSSTFA